MRFTSNILSLLQHFLFPQHCPVCGRLGAAFCDECLEQAVGSFSPFCSVCGGLWSAAACKNAFPCYFASAYDGYAKEFLLNLKYRNSRSLGIPMGRLMGRLFEKTGAEIILPVPLHINSSRAFNQTELLAQGISEVQNIPVSDVLFWSDDFGRQVEKKAGERKALPKSAIKCRPLFGKKVLLVDDVYTTGSTVRSAGEAVRQAGGKVAAAYFWCRSVRRKNSDEFDDIIDALSLEIG